LFDDPLGLRDPAAHPLLLLTQALAELELELLELMQEPVVEELLLRLEPTRPGGCTARTAVLYRGPSLTVGTANTTSPTTRGIARRSSSG